AGRRGWGSAGRGCPGPHARAWPPRRGRRRTPARGRPRERPRRCGRSCAWRQLASAIPTIPLLTGDSLRIVVEEAEPSSGSRVHRPTGREQDLFYMPSTTTPARAQTRPVDLPDNAGRAAAGIAIVLVAQLMFTLDATVVNVALPRIDTALGFGPASL